METIGDAYIAVAGMFPRRDDHAAAALRFALGLHAAAATEAVEEGEPPTQLRVGVHTGPITAGLIGRTRAKYCLFGDTARAPPPLRTQNAPFPPVCVPHRSSVSGDAARRR